MRLIASIEDPLVIAKILAHLDRQVPLAVSPVLVPPVRGPPGQGTLELG